jgi:hypothetical protein
VVYLIANSFYKATKIFRIPANLKKLNGLSMNSIVFKGPSNLTWAHTLKKMVCNQLTLWFSYEWAGLPPPEQNWRVEKLPRFYLGRLLSHVYITLFIFDDLTNHL